MTNATAQNDAAHHTDAPVQRHVDAEGVCTLTLTGHDATTRSPTTCSKR